MDAIASLVFGIIVINIVKSMGVTSRSGIIACNIEIRYHCNFVISTYLCWNCIFRSNKHRSIRVLYNRWTSSKRFCRLLLWNIGLILLAVVIILACLTTAIGLITANAEYFHTLLPKISYKAFVIFFSAFSFVVANFGLANIITFSLPVLMFLYPLAIVLMILTFLSPLFNHKRFVYVSATIVTFFVSIIDGFKQLCKSLEIDYFNWLSPIINFYETYLPLYKKGLDG